MSKILDLLAREPVRAAALGLVGATLALLSAAGVHLSEALTAGVIGWTAAVLGLAEAVRRNVTPASKRAAAQRAESGE